MSYWYMFPCCVNESSISSLISDLFRAFQNDASLTINLYISSTGGDIDSAIRFYDFVKSSETNINTIGFGQVDSAALLLFLCGKERILIENCRLRMHAPTYGGTQQSQVISVHSETVSLLQKLDNRYFEILTNELPKIEKIREIYDKGQILDTMKALELGIATKVDKKLPVFK